MAKRAKSHSDLVADFIEAIRSLELACFNFDCVDFSAAKSISNLLHQLVDDRGQNRSHVTRLGIRDKISIFHSTNLPPPPNGYHNHLAGVMFGIGTDEYGRPVPRAFNLPSFLEEGRRKVAAQSSDIESWLDASIVRLNSGDWLTRRQIIRFVRDQDAGAHSDPALDAMYADFKASFALNRDSSINIQGVVTQVHTLLQNPALATLRQIAHELLSSIYSHKDTSAEAPRCITYIYDANGNLTKIVRPKIYCKLPINVPVDILVEV